MIENLPKPPKTDEIESKLERLKKFNKKLIDDKDVVSVVEDSKVQVKILDDKTKDKKIKKNDVEKIVIKKEESVSDMDDLLGKNLLWSNDMNTEEYEVTEIDEEDSENKHFDNKAEENVVEKCTKSKSKSKCENEEETGVNISDEEYGAEIKEFNNWYYSKLKERRYSKDVDKRSEKLYDKIVPESGWIDVKGMRDHMYMQVPSNTDKEDEVDKRADVSAILALLQAIFAILIVVGKTLHEQSVLTARHSKLSQSSLLSHFQPEASLSPESSCYCQTKSKVTTASIVRVSSMANKVSTGVMWFREIWVAVSAMKERLTADIATTLYQVGCGVFDIIAPEAAFERTPVWIGL